MFTSLVIAPDSAVIGQGETLPLLLQPRDQRGQLMSLTPSLTWTTSEPGIAIVTGNGVVRGVTPGSAAVFATVTIGQVTKTVGMFVRIFPVPIATTVVLTSGPVGWQPAVAYVKAGGAVEWRIGQVDYAGVPVDKVYLMDGDYRGIDSVHVVSGGATRTFPDPRVIRYCSGGCWDPPDFGLIYVQ